MSSLESISSDAVYPVAIYEESNNCAFMHQLAAIVAKWLSLFSKIAQDDKQEFLKIEKKYTHFTKNSADAINSQGSYNFMASAVSLAVYAASFGLGARNDQMMVQKVAENLVQPFGQLFGTHMASSSKNNDAVANIQYTKIQERAQKAQTEGNIKDTPAQVLQAEINRHRSNTASGG